MDEKLSLADYKKIFEDAKMMLRESLISVEVFRSTMHMADTHIKNFDELDPSVVPDEVE